MNERERTCIHSGDRKVKTKCKQQFLLVYRKSQVKSVEEIRNKVGGPEGQPAILESSHEGWERSLHSRLWSSAWTGAGGGCNMVLK